MTRGSRNRAVTRARGSRNRAVNESVLLLNRGMLHGGKRYVNYC